MKANRFLIVIWFLLTVVGNKSLAQNSGSKALVVFLPILEKQFDVVFTFADENIKGIFVSIPHKELSLEDLLGELEKQTNLSFKKVNSRYIAIGKNMRDIMVSGRIIDKSTKEDLVGALVYSENSHALSDENGWFSIKMDQEKDSILILRHTGYKPLYLNEKHWGNDSVVYELTPDVQVLDEVVVNYIAKGIDKLPDGSVQMNTQNLEVLPGLSEPDVLRAVQVLPGIQSINESVSNINTRGGTNDQSLVLWDGVKMYQTGHFFGLISAFNSHLIHKTSVVKNGTSAAFDEGVSGIIDMQQQDYPVNNYEISTGLNMVSADMIIKSPVTKKLSLIVGARHSINKLFLSPTYKSYYDRAFEHTEVLLNQEGNDQMVDDLHNFSFYDLSCKFLYNVSDKDKIRFSLLNVNNKIAYEESALIRDTLHSKKSHLDQSSILANLNYTRFWTENHTTHVSAFISNYYLDGTNVSMVDNQHHLQKNEVIDLGLKLDTKNIISQTIALAGGYQFKEVGIRNQDNIRRPDYNRDVKNVLRIHSLYTEAEFKELFQKLYVRAGLRTNYFSKFNEFSFEPRAAFSYKLNKQVSFEALAEMKSQHTTQVIDYQTDFLGVEKRKWVLSNNQTVPLLKSQQFSLGMQYKRKNFLASLECYTKQVRGIISPSQGFQNQFQYVYGIGEYYAQGLELLVNKRYMQSNFWINYALSQNEYFFQEFIPSSFPNNLDIRHALSLGGSYHTKHIELSAGFNFRTGKPYTRPARESNSQTSEIVYEAPNSSRLDDYIRLDMSAKYKFTIKNAKGELGISVWNILNRENVINVFYGQNDDGEIEQTTQNALRFTPNMSLRLRF